MRPALVLNPLTMASVERNGDGSPVALHLRAFARRRSLAGIRIERDLQPRLFDGLLDWLNGGAGDVEPLLDTPHLLDLWRKGLFIAPDEAEALPPGAAPEFGDGAALARAITPACASLLDAGPTLAQQDWPLNRMFAERGFCELPPVISPVDIAAMNAFYDALESARMLVHSREPSNRYVLHNDPVARCVQAALVPMTSAVTGRPLNPSYTFFSEYVEGSALPRHTDRKQCEVTFSLYLNYLPEPSDNLCPWPLIIHDHGEEVPTFQHKGGGSLLLGRELAHSRPALPEGHRARMVFLHYVLEDFVGPLE